MITYIALLRGINVSGKRLIKLDALKSLCATLGFEDVQTYIQSGNIVFKSKQKNTALLQQQLAKAIDTQFGFDVPVIIKPFIQFNKILLQNPYTADSSIQPDHLHITFLSSAADPLQLSKIDAANYLPDSFTVGEDAIYLYCPGGYGNTKLNNTFFENKLKVTATTRNLKTCGVLAEMARKISI